MSRNTAALEGCVELIHDRLYFLCVNAKRIPSDSETDSSYFFTVDTNAELQYIPFDQDFGPNNIGQVVYFSKIVNSIMDKHKDKRVTLFSYASRRIKTNVATMLGCYCILYHGMKADHIYKIFGSLSDNFSQFRDASPLRENMYPIDPLHVLRGLEKAVEYDIFNLDRFNIQEYFHYEQVVNGDFNIILPGKFLAFSGPNENGSGVYKYTPEQYFPIFEKFNVTGVVRLNNRTYSRRKFIQAGYAHHELFFQDGSCPNLNIIDEFIRVAEEAEGVLAVHCKAGLGRTGTLIGCYMMKHYDMSAEEVIGWIRLARPGSIIGPQQTFLKSLEGPLREMGRQTRLNPDEAPRSFASMRPSKLKKKSSTSSTSSSSTPSSSSSSSSSAPSSSSSSSSSSSHRGENNSKHPSSENDRGSRTALRTVSYNIRSSTRKKTEESIARASSSSSSSSSSKSKKKSEGNNRLTLSDLESNESLSQGDRLLMVKAANEKTRTPVQ